MRDARTRCSANAAPRSCSSSTTSTWCRRSSSRLYVLDFGTLIAERPDGRGAERRHGARAYLGELTTTQPSSRPHEVAAAVHPSRRRALRPSAPLLELRDVYAGYGPFRALFDVSFSVPEGKRRRAPRRERRRQDHDRTRRHRTACRSSPARCASTAPTSRGMQAVADRAARRRARARRTLGVRFAHRRGEPHARLPAQPRPQAASPAGSSARTSSSRASASGGRSSRARCPAASSGCSRSRACSVRPPRLLVVDELSLGLAPIIIDEVYATLEQVRRGRHRRC